VRKRKGFYREDAKAAKKIPPSFLIVPVHGLKWDFPSVEPDKQF
jgi:hypothetical protein